MQGEQFTVDYSEHQGMAGVLIMLALSGVIYLVSMWVHRKKGGK